MIDLTYIPWFDLLGVAVAVVPIAVLAAMTMVDLRAVMLLRAISILRRRSRAGETRIRGDEWAPVA